MSHEVKGQKYYCKGGDVVYVEDCKDGNILIHWNGKTRVRPITHIGTELFLEDPTRPKALKNTVKKTELTKTKKKDSHKPKTPISVFSNKPYKSKVVPNIVSPASKRLVGETFVLQDETGEVIKVKVVDTSVKVEYIGMGGAYYGAGTRKVTDSDGGKELEDGTLLISVDSPLAKALAYSYGSKVNYKVDGKQIEYTIVPLKSTRGDLTR